MRPDAVERGHVNPAGRAMVSGLSIQTNTSAGIALQQLTVTSNALQRTQLRITTGLKVPGPQEDAATFNIATRLRGEIAGINAVKTALATGEATVDVAVSAAESVADLLTEIKAKVVQANQSGLDSSSRSALEDDFVALRDQITTIVQTAEFNNVNLVQQSASAFDVLSSVDGSVIRVSAQPLDTTTLGLNDETLATSSGATAALTAIESAITTASDKLAALGSSAKRVEIQADFTSSLVNVLNEGLGNLVDADLAEESARLQALQIQQELSVQALAIANASPQSVLQLFPVPGR